MYLTRRTPEALQSLGNNLIALATGAMLGLAFFHLMTESFEHAAEGQVSTSMVSGLTVGALFVGFAFEKLLNAKCHHGGSNVVSHGLCEHGHEHERKAASGLHTHDSRGGHIHVTGHMSLLAHGLDNLSDGILIGIAYNHSVSLGLAVTLAIMLHELPLEFGGFGVLVNAGFKPFTAVKINFYSGIVALIGTLSVLVAEDRFKALPAYLTPIGLGIVLYITLAGLVPMLQKEQDRKRSAIQFGLMVLGVVMLYLCKLADVG
jgi:zinc transporter ZupT